MVKHPAFVLLVAASFVLAGCAGRGGDSKDSNGSGKAPAYKSFDLYLKPLIKTGSADNRWELYPGVKVEAWAFAPDPDSPATVPGPEIRVREGDTVEVTFHIVGGTPMPHTIHWHGVHVPWDMDGVPYLSQAPLGDPQFGGNNEFSFTYVFSVTGQSGTYWYHCHVDTQHHLDMGMYGALIVEPADEEQDPAYAQEATLFLDEWDKSHIHSNLAADQILSRSGDPEETASALYGQLRDYYHMSLLTNAEQVYERAKNDPNLPPPVKDLVNQYAPSTLLRENRTWYPVTYPAYYAEYDTFLINGRAFPYTQPVFVHSGETLRIRLINAGSLVHAMHIHGHHFLVTHKDGYLLPAPYHADTVLIGPGERYDLYLELDNPGPWMLHDHFPQYEQNDHINPGGMMTHVCYQDGWEYAAQVCDLTKHPGGHVPSAGEVVELMTKILGPKQNAYVDPVYTGGHHDD